MIYLNVEHHTVSFLSPNWSLKCVVEGIIAPAHLPGSYILISDFHTTLGVPFWWRNCLRILYKFFLIFRCKFELVFNLQEMDFKKSTRNSSELCIWYNQESVNIIILQTQALWDTLSTFPSPKAKPESCCESSCDMETKQSNFWVKWFVIKISFLGR